MRPSRVDYDLSIGTVIDDRFTLRRLIGSDALGGIWIASDALSPEREVVLKLLPRPHREDPRLVQRFARRAKLLLELDHPNIVRALTCRTAGEHLYVAYELVRGHSLAEEIERRIDRAEPFALDEVDVIARGILSAISYAHERKLLHHDLAPSSVVFRSERGNIETKVLNFDRAAVSGEPYGPQATAAWMLGRAIYQAPEVKAGGDGDERADIFSIGTMFFELLTLRRAWVRDARDQPLLARGAPPADERNAPVAVMLRVRASPRPRPSAFREGIPHAVDEVLARAMAIAPEERFPSAAALWAALESALRATSSSIDHDSSLLDTRTLDPPTLTVSANDDLAKVAIMLEEPPTWGISVRRDDAPPPHRAASSVGARANANKATRTSPGNIQDVIDEAVRGFQDRRSGEPAFLEDGRGGVEGSATLQPSATHSKPSSSRRFERLTVLSWALAVLALTTLFFLVSRARLIPTIAPSTTGIEHPAHSDPDALERSSPGEGASSPGTHHLAKLLDAVRRQPEDARLLGRLGRQALRVSAGVPASPETASIRRQAAMGTILGDRAELEASVTALIRQGRGARPE